MHLWPVCGVGSKTLNAHVQNSTLRFKNLLPSCLRTKSTILEQALFSQHDCEAAIYLEYYGDKNNNKVPDPEEIGVIPLEDDGEFRSKECIELLKQADIVVTNPPFSLFREYVAQLVRYEKKFVIIGNKHAIQFINIESHIIELRNQKVILNSSVATLNSIRL